jgi:hypothetical protein
MDCEDEIVRLLPATLNELEDKFKGRICRHGLVVRLQVLLTEYKVEKRGELFVRVSN